VLTSAAVGGARVRRARRLPITVSALAANHACLVYYDAPTGFTETYGGTLVRTATPRTRQSRAAAFVLSALLAAATALTAACSSTSAAKAPPLEQSVVTVGIVKGEIGALPVYVGSDEQLFAKQGITLKISNSYPNDDEALQALQDGKVDIVYGDYSRYFQAQALGQERLALVAEGYLAGPGSVNLVTLQSKGGTMALKDIQAMLARKKVLVPATGDSDPDKNFTVPELMLASTIKAMAADTKLDKATAESELIPMPQDQMAEALGAQTAEAAVMTEPYWSKASVANPLTVALDLTVGANQDMPMGGYFSTADFSLGHPNLLKAFTAALNAAKQAASTRTIAVQTLKNHYEGVTDATVTGISLGTFPQTVNVARLKRVVDAMNQFQLAWVFDPSVIVPACSVGLNTNGCK
jgi:NitT/TauT family transport system substrate-binding protein